MKVRALVLMGYGINCENEMAKAALLAGAEVTKAHVKAWLLDEVKLVDFDLLLFPGGFSFGDELGAAKAFANRIAFSHRKEDLLSFIDRGGCILGVCNGFQLLVKLGILSGGSLLQNAKGRFESRWVHQKVEPSACVFTQGLHHLFLPVRHAEGNFVVPDDIDLGNRVVLRYATAEGEIATSYPDNPNGSLRSIAGICDRTGRVLGMMPHPEAAIFFTQTPHWIREKERLKRSQRLLPEEGPGLALFKNGINYLRQR